MVENRARIEKQILLGRQSVHKALQHKHSTDPRHILLQKSVDNTASSIVGSMTISPPASGSDCVPLSVDTDAEAAFARASSLYRPGGISKNASPSRDSDRPDVPMGLSRRRKWATQFEAPTVDEDNTEDTDRLETVPNGERLEDAQTGGFFSRFRNNSSSLSKMALPSFSLEHSSPNPHIESNPETKAENHWSSESSSDDDYPLNIVGS